MAISGTIESPTRYPVVPLGDDVRHPLLLALLLPACTSSIIDPSNDTDPKDTDTVTNPNPEFELSVTEVDFGEVHYGERIQSNFTVFNHGGGDLVASIAATEPVTVQPSEVTVLPGGSYTLTIAIQPLTYEVFDDPVVFTTNDPDEGSFSLPVSGATITDEDGDGYDAVAAGGDDCDDTDDTVNPSQAEVWYNGVDNDCSGGSDYDQDGDGFETDAYNDDPTRGGGDCQDLNAAYHPGAEDTPYDGADTDCGGGDDYDIDGDGYRSDDYGAGTDCDDTDDTVNVDGTETLNGKDDNCDGEVDSGATPHGVRWTYTGQSTNDRAGSSVALGDLDGDGFAELVSGAPNAGSSSPTAAGRGGVAVFYSNSLPEGGVAFDDADTWFRGDNSTDLMGYALALLDDADGDGKPDLAVSATGVNSNAGVVYLISGDDLMIGGSQDDAWATISGSTSNSLGRGLATDVDLDGDGLEEVIMAYTSASSNYLALAYGGELSGAVALANVDSRWSTDGSSEAFYRGMSVGGDFDGDGTQDLILCDATSDSYNTNGGAVWALWGSSTRYAAAETDIEGDATVLLAGASNEALGASCQLGEDANGDGRAELWAFHSDDGLYVYDGRAGRASLDTTADASVVYTWHSSSVDPTTLRRIGDWTGDGVSEIAAFMDDGSLGEVDVFSSELRSGTWLQRDARLADLSGSSDEGNGNLGYGFGALPADVDRDGDMDVAIGDPEWNYPQGKVYVFENSLE